MLISAALLELTKKKEEHFQNEVDDIAQNGNAAALLGLDFASCPPQAV